MPVAVRCPIAIGQEHVARPIARYDLVHRLSACCARRGVRLLAFGVGPREVRALLDGPSEDVALAVLALRSGTARAVRSAGGALMWGDTEHQTVRDEVLATAIAWTHAATGEGDPLASPWSSHRDLLGFRRAGFYDADPMRARVDPEEVHRLAGGAPLPPRRRALSDAGLDRILRVAAAVLGVPASDRTCFRLFVHLARAQGWATPDLERALRLTGRRIRQLAAAPEPLLPVAEVHLADARLCQVP
jgi:hypothetical protein